MKTEEKIYTQHAEHSEWMNKLEFYNDEISILKNRLEEIAKKNSHKDVLAQVEHFENQFAVQQENIDEISHSIKIDEEALQKDIEIYPIEVDKRRVTFHAKEKESIESFEKNFNKLREEFKAFAVKWM